MSTKIGEEIAKEALVSGNTNNKKLEENTET